MEFCLGKFLCFFLFSLNYFTFLASLRHNWSRFVSVCLSNLKSNHLPSVFTFLTGLLLLVLLLLLSRFSRLQLCATP